MSDDRPPDYVREQRGSDRRQRCRRGDDEREERTRRRIRWYLEVLTHVTWLAISVGAALDYVPADVLLAIGTFLAKTGIALGG